MNDKVTMKWVRREPPVMHEQLKRVATGGRLCLGQALMDLVASRFMARERSSSCFEQACIAPAPGLELRHDYVLSCASLGLVLR